MIPIAHNSTRRRIIMKILRIFLLGFLFLNSNAFGTIINIAGIKHSCTPTNSSPENSCEYKPDKTRCSAKVFDRMERIQDLNCKVYNVYTLSCNIFDGCGRFVTKTTEFERELVHVELGNCE